jgi:hypothetical protein
MRISCMTVVGKRRPSTLPRRGSLDGIRVGPGHHRGHGLFHVAPLAQLAQRRGRHGTEGTSAGNTAARTGYLPALAGTATMARQTGTMARCRSKEIGKTMRCKQTDCNRRAHSRGMCTTHYRRWRAGQDLDSPIRGYVRYDDAEDGIPRPAVKPIRRVRREPPFAKELALLRELGLR